MFFSAIKEVYGPTKPRTTPTRSADGSILLKESSINARWKEHFTTLFFFFCFVLFCFVLIVLFCLFGLRGGGVCLFVCFLGFFFFFFFAFPSYISGVHHFWVRFLRMWPFFFNPTIKVVTFRLRGSCVLGVFLLPAFIRLGHERQDLLGPCDEMHVCTD